MANRSFFGRIGAFARSFAAKSLSIVRNFTPITAIRSSLTRTDTNRGLNANVVMACIFWIQRVFTESVLIVQRRISDDMWERWVDSPLETLIAKPNDYYGGDELWKATVLSYVMDGNGFWWKIRNNIGDVIQLWYVPHWMIAPVSASPGSQLGSTEFIVGYQLLNGAKPVGFLSRDDVVHFRFGLDPEDTRLGISPLKCLMREIEADMAAADFTDTVLGNMGIPGLVIAPKDATWTPTPDQVKEMKEYIDGQSFRGENQGKTLVLGKPTEVLQLGGSDPNKVMLPSLRDIAEERVCAVIGIPAAVVGFGSGLQSTKVGATMRELVKMAWVTCINPTATTMAKQITLQLLPDFVSQSRRFRARFDNSDASYIQDEYDVRAQTNARLVEAGILRVDRAQHELGLEVDSSRAVYLGPPVAAPVAKTPEVPPADPTTPPADPSSETDTPNAQKSQPTRQELVTALADRWLPLIGANGSSNGNGRHHSHN